MLKKLLFWLPALLLSLTAAAQGAPRISILGDSYSTFAGYIPEGHAVWYTGSTESTDVERVEQTWWWQVIRRGGYALERNDSYSGATVSYRGYRGDDYSDRSFITRLPDVGEPDILLIFGGTNDSWAGVPAGDFKEEDISREDLYTYRPALSKLLSDARTRYPRTRIWFLLNSELREDISSSTLSICARHGIPCIALRDIDKQNGHPTVRGMEAIAEQVLAAIGPAAAHPLPYENDYCFGLDLSFVHSAGQRGQVFYDTDGTERSPWEIFRNHGYNWARLMICNEPSRLGQGIDYVVEGARELKKHGYHFALDYMLSDDWSNPMKQPVPSAWQGLSPAAMEQALHDFVYSTLTRLQAEGLMPEIVQIGNEIGNGALWPSGRVYYGDEKRDQSQWKQFTDYLKAGIRAVREADPTGRVRVMLHVDFGGDVAFTDSFFGKMEEYGVDYDLIGYSFYPWSHGTLMDLRDNLAWAIRRFRKPVIVIETGFYSEPSDYFEKKGVQAAFPETPEGQKEWFQAVNEIVMAAPEGMGLGVFWWEPMFRGRGFFDDGTHVAKPIVDAFRRYTRPAARTDGNPRIWDFDRTP